MLISQAFPSEFLKAEDLGTKTVRVIMDYVEMRDVGDDYKPVLYFQGKEKGLVLNITNSNTIEAIYGDETEGWRDQPLMLFMERVDFKGKKVPAIRVRPPLPQEVSQDARVVNAVPALANGTNGRAAPIRVPIRETNAAHDDVPF